MLCLAVHVHACHHLFAGRTQNLHPQHAVWPISIADNGGGPVSSDAACCRISASFCRTRCSRRCLIVTVAERDMAGVARSGGWAVAMAMVAAATTSMSMEYCDC